MPNQIPSIDKRNFVDRWFFVCPKVLDYEVAFVPANDYASKTDRIIAFTDIEVTSYYAVKFAIANDSVDVLDKRMPIRIIVYPFR